MNLTHPPGVGTDDAPPRVRGDVAACEPRTRFTVSRPAEAVWQARKPVSLSRRQFKQAISRIRWLVA